MLLISQYREHEKLFRNVNCKKKSVWELITASMTAENLNFSPRPEQVEGKWKSLTLAFRKCCEKNAHFTGKKQSSMFTGLMFARMRQAAALRRRIDSLRVAVPSPRGKPGGRERLRKAGTNRVM